MYYYNDNNNKESQVATYASRVPPDLGADGMAGTQISRRRVWKLGDASDIRKLHRAVRCGCSWAQSQPWASCSRNAAGKLDGKLKAEITGQSFASSL